MHAHEKQGEHNLHEGQKECRLSRKSIKHLLDLSRYHLWDEAIGSFQRIQMANELRDRSREHIGSIQGWKKSFFPILKYLALFQKSREKIHAYEAYELACQIHNEEFLLLKERFACDCNLKLEEVFTYDASWDKLRLAAKRMHMGRYFHFVIFARAYVELCQKGNLSEGQKKRMYLCIEDLRESLAAHFSLRYESLERENKLWKIFGQETLEKEDFFDFIKEYYLLENSPFFIHHQEIFEKDSEKTSFQTLEKLQAWIWDVFLEKELLLQSHITLEDLREKEQFEVLLSRVAPSNK